MRDFINSCLVTKNIGQIVKQSMYNAGYPHIMDNWVTSWEKSLPEIALALKDSGIDDDIDVALKRDDYNKLENYLLNNKYVSDEYRFYLPTVDKDRKENIIQFLNKNVFYYDNSKYHIKGNLWIDIFPIDGLPNNKIYRKIYLFNLKKILYRLVLIKFEDKYGICLSCYSTFKKILFRFISFIMKPIPFEKIRLLFLKYASKIDCNESKELTNYVCGIFEKEAFPAELFDEFIDLLK